MPGYVIDYNCHSYCMYGDFLPFEKLNSSACSYKKKKPTRCTISQIYFDKELCMFQTNLLSIISSKHVEFFIKINLRSCVSR